jgi:6,7-dimethyl-8-ribityllumazine synthase
MQRTHYARTVAVGDALKLRVGVVVSDFNADITERLLKGTLETLREWHVPEAHVRIVHVPGAFEIPLGCRMLLGARRKTDALVALGCVIKGETKHDEYISHAVAHALQDLMRESGVPIGFGIITPNTLAQAKVRSRGDTNKGGEAARAALMMALM